jgi:threonine dehydratase
VDIATVHVIDRIVTVEETDVAPMLRFEPADAFLVCDACGAIGVGHALEGAEPT